MAEGSLLKVGAAENPYADVSLSIRYLATHMIGAVGSGARRILGMMAFLLSSSNLTIAAGMLYNNKYKLYLGIHGSPGSLYQPDPIISRCATATR